MKLQFADFTEENAKEICTWQYEGEYHLYSCPAWSRACDKSWAITIAEKREKEFKSVVDEKNNLCGYVRFRYIHKDEEVIVGLGLKPDLCGHGVGSTLMEVIKEYCDEAYHGKKIVLEVRTFNKRAIRCYEKAGFKQKVMYSLNTPIGCSDFIRMEYEK